MVQSEQSRLRDSRDPITNPNQNHHQEDLCPEKKPLPVSSGRSYGSQSAAGHNGEVPAEIGTYRSRFWILAIFSLLNIVHIIEWTIWGPISESMNAAFPGWGPSTVSLMVNWGTIIYSLLFIPICWAVQRYGLRASVVTSFAILNIGTVLRCITRITPAFTILCHVCAMLVGVACPVLLAGPTLIGSNWFPVHERTTATAIMVGCHQLGIVGSYLEPFLVRPPGPGVTQADIKDDVRHLVYITAGMAAVLLVTILVYFPSKPPSPPSLSSSEERIKFQPALKALISNKKFVILLLSYGVFMGPPVVWITVIDFSLLPLGFHQEKAMWVGVTAVLVSSACPVIVGRVNDLFHGYTKILLIVLMMATTAFFFWFLLLSYKVLPITDWQVYVSTVGGLACSYGTVPLFLEMAIDLVYPVPEILVTGVMIASDNLTGFIFLMLFDIPDEKHLWVTYTLTLCSSVPIVLLAAVTFPNTRMQIDSGNAPLSV